MSIESTLRSRGENQCELCRAPEALRVFEVPPASDGSAGQCMLVCATCDGQLQDPSTVDSQHWACLGETMWSQVPAVQVMAWRMLKLLSSEGWAHDLLDMLYLDEDTLAWAESALLDPGDHSAAGSERLVQDNAGHIEGRVSGQEIVILTEFVKKSG